MASSQDNLDLKIAWTVKHKVCFEDNIKGQNKFINESIIDKDIWENSFCNCSYHINENEEKYVEEDNQRLQLIVVVNVLNLGKTLEKLFSGNESLNSLYLEGIKDFIL